MSDAVVIQRLLLVTVLAGIIGYERERHGRAAGFRTHILVGLGSCLVMLTGIHLKESLAGSAAFDPTRMAAQVVSGIGFLGAGTILRFRASVRGLTTAASLWAAAGIGLAVGSGFVVGALAATGIVGIILFAFSSVERAMRRDIYGTVAMESDISGKVLAEIREVLAECQAEIRDLDVKKAAGGDFSQIEIHVRLLGEKDKKQIVKGLAQLDAVRRAHWVEG